tara:strand:- start:283 stop:501 length:219 start_codon:yes stop_codon:yes gene_type:complete
MKVTKSQLKQIIMEELSEALGMDQEGKLYSQVLPILMNIAGNNHQLAIEMLETLTKHLKDSETAGAVGETGV